MKLFVNARLLFLTIKSGDYRSFDGLLSEGHSPRLVNALVFRQKAMTVVTAALVEHGTGAFLCRCGNRRRRHY